MLVVFLDLLTLRLQQHAEAGDVENVQAAHVREGHPLERHKVWLDYSIDLFVGNDDGTIDCLTMGVQMDYL